MNLYNQAFEQALNQNSLDEEKWRNYKKNVNDTRENVNTFIKSHKMEIMVPLGKKAFVRGTLQHTNDILVSHSSNYFSVVSNYQANEILQRRNEACEQRLKDIEKERELFRGKLDVPKNDVFSEQEIIEDYNEEAEIEWRKRHRESVRKQKMQEADERRTKTDGEIDNLLDQYELMEELTSELENLDDKQDYDSLLKLINGETKAPESKKRIAHEDIVKDKKSKETVTRSKSEEIIKAVDQTSTKDSKKKRKVRFSTSLEDVKIIESVPEIVKNEQHAVFPAIQIKFHHSCEKFSAEVFNGTDDDIMFKHPGDVLKVLNFSNAEQPKTKSILKETNYKYNSKEVVKTSASFKDYDDEEVFQSISKFPLICGDVIERNQEENIQPVNELKSGKKVSKFKELRNKVR